MKIAIISSSYHPYNRGGGEYSAKALAEGLGKEGAEVFVISAYRYDQEEIIDSIKVYRIKHPNIYWSFDSEQQTSYRKLAWHLLEGYNPRVETPLKNILQKEKPDILHIRNAEDFSPYSAKVAHQLKIPVVVTLNSYTWLCPKATMFRNRKNCDNQCLDCKLITLPKKHLSRYVDAVVGVSQYMLDKHTQYRYFPNALQEVIYTSAPAKFSPLPFFQKDHKTIGYIGRIHPTKGVAQIIRLFLESDENHSAYLYIAGEGPAEYVKECYSAAENNPRIKFLGRVKAEEFYPKVDAVLVNSLWNEPFPRVLVEAYTHGRPVIASSTGGTSEMIKEGKTGYVYNPFNLNEFRNKLKLFLSSDKNEVLKFHEQVKEFHINSFPDQTLKHLSLYRNLTKEN